MQRKFTLPILVLASGLFAPAGAWAQPTMAWSKTISMTAELEGADQMAVDAEGNAVVLGYLPVEQDFYAVKLAPSGTVLWSRIIGGSGIDHADDVVIDAVGDILLVGRTLSIDFPTAQPYQATKNGSADAFIMKLSGADGSTMRSTYFGGSRSEWGRGIALGPDGSIAIVGATDSLDLVTVDPVQEGLTLAQCFCDDAFITRFTPDLDAVVFSTYLGGAFDDHASDLAFDESGAITFAGVTTSDDWPLMNPLQPVYGGGDNDLFVARIGPDGTLVYSTYVGGEDLERIASIALDATGAVVLAGSTRSVLYPTTPGAFQEDFVGGLNACEVPFGQDYNCEDMFVTRIAPDGNDYDFSTFIGGLSPDEPRNMVLDHEGRAHVIGYTYSDDFPLGAPFGSVVTLQLTADGSDLNYLIAHDTPGPNAGSAIAIHGTDLFIATSVGLPYDTYVAKFIEKKATCPGDMSGDGVVNVEDLVELISAWGPCSTSCTADMNDDDTVDVSDLVMLIMAWGSCD